MSYFYQSATQQNSNASANTDTYLMNIKTAAASMRATIQKLQAGSYATPADNAIRLRLHRTSTLLTAGRHLELGTGGRGQWRGAGCQTATFWGCVAVWVACHNLSHLRGLGLPNR